MGDRRNRGQFAHYNSGYVGHVTKSYSECKALSDDRKLDYKKLYKFI